ncbi:hypothetical protein C7U92_20425 [Bradyrhizobium sp. WBOS7]|uniref:Uncharacterized protein n=1 Tax=Bradyrhizobium betae TaxID=244734 RepID=A0AAE9N356_9BRAD|nr:MULTISPECIES: hypothetical protein [Bradyrhizobium]MDD1572965.1 hypothetical protein [Bradyrhizobium sp. WBOS1]UUO33171.1 hypothetical protein DCK84_00320 [Bradyrhizobium sp. WBOS01]MDD1529428.1 hypothetical protein [Bradyrhizobium sp. WBOS2]MDD1579062.1 hypothetical protein [Bradyrhizobium sp. WBOS7]MDD1601869.1 hypothetical protein [Bradyrhizobium sp. WBOS16]
MADDRFRPGVLAELLKRMEVAHEGFIEQSEIAHSKALFGFRMAEEAMQRKDSQELERDVTMAADKLRHSLSMRPYDSFLWLMLYSLETNRKGIDLNALGYIEQSYSLAPLEAWIALRRNKLALAAFSMLNENVQRHAVKEFSALVESGFIEDAVIILMSVGWPERNRLVNEIGRVDIVPREAFARRLAREGTHLNVPGVEIGERPWQ